MKREENMADNPGIKQKPDHMARVLCDELQRVCSNLFTTNVLEKSYINPLRLKLFCLYKL